MNLIWPYGGYIIFSVNIVSYTHEYHGGLMYKAGNHQQFLAMLYCIFYTYTLLQVQLGGLIPKKSLKTSAEGMINSSGV